MVAMGWQGSPKGNSYVKDILGEAGPPCDELNHLGPEVTLKTIELKEEWKDFVDKISQF